MQYRHDPKVKGLAMVGRGLGIEEQDVDGRLSLSCRSVFPSSCSTRPIPQARPRPGERWGECRVSYHPLPGPPVWCVFIKAGDRLPQVHGEAVHGIGQQLEERT